MSWLLTLGGQRPGFRKRRNSEYPGVLRTGQITVVYQPIVNITNGEVFAYEALVRSDSPLFRDPISLFAEAIEANACGVLGRKIREAATEGCPDAALFLNVHPREFDESWLVQPDDPIFTHAHPIYLEITESVPLSHFSYCHSVLREVRSKGLMLAIDDFGAGYSNLKYIADLTPEIVKLDRELVANLGRSQRLRQLVRNIVRLCVDMGASVVAEGVEHADEADAAAECGAHYGQGWFFARPANPPPIVSLTTRRSLSAG
jgi:EAL domain-containing protein (putative c-di-GMP-specific phosphodiesterase class I)